MNTLKMILLGNIMAFIILFLGYLVCTMGYEFVQQHPILGTIVAINLLASPAWFVCSGKGPYFESF